MSLNKLLAGFNEAEGKTSTKTSEPTKEAKIDSGKSSNPPVSEPTPSENTSTKAPSQAIKPGSTEPESKSTAPSKPKPKSKGRDKMKVKLQPKK